MFSKHLSLEYYTYLWLYVRFDFFISHIVYICFVLKTGCDKGGGIALRRLVHLGTIYTVDSKVVLGRLIQRWSRELTRINDVTIPCPLLYLDSLPGTPPRFLVRYSTSTYIYHPLPPSLELFLKP
jgi:hypothetical protein